MSKFVLLFICLVTIQTGWALQCKRCKDSNELTCKTLQDETCGGAPANNEAACLTYIFKDGDKEITEKKCVNQLKDKKYECVKTKSSDVEVKCETCKTDFCNSADKFSIGVISLVAAVIALVAPRII